MIYQFSLDINFTTTKIFILAINIVAWTSLFTTIFWFGCLVVWHILVLIKVYLVASPMSKTDPFREGYDLALGQDRSNRCRNRGGLRVSGSLSVRSTRNVPSSRDVLVALLQPALQALKII